MLTNLAQMIQDNIDELQADMEPLFMLRGQLGDKIQKVDEQLTTKKVRLERFQGLLVDVQAMIAEQQQPPAPAEPPL